MTTELLALEQQFIYTFRELYIILDQHKKMTKQALAARQRPALHHQFTSFGFRTRHNRLLAHLRHLPAGIQRWRPGARHRLRNQRPPPSTELL